VGRDPGGDVVGGYPILTAIIVTPLLGALVLLLVPARRPDRARAIGMLASVATMGFALLMLWKFQTGFGGFQFLEHNRWFDSLGVGYIVGVDGFSLFMVVVTGVLFPIGLLASTRGVEHRVKAYTFWFLLLEASIMGIFLSLDLVAFFVFWEAMLVPMYFLIAGWGSANRRYASMKFFIYTAAGSAFLLASLLTLAFLHQADTGVLTFDYRTLAAWGGLSKTTEYWLFLGFMISFAIKAPLFPFHTWLPDTTGNATPGTSVLLICVLDKIGTYGMLRFCLELFPGASAWATPVVVTLALVSIVYGALLALGQDDLLVLTGLTSLSHFGFIVLGIFVLNDQGVSGATFYMFNHGLATAVLFLAAGYLIRRTGTPLLSRMGGVERRAPVLAALLLLGGLGTLGLPGLSPFVSEFLVMLGAFRHHWWVGTIAVSGIVLAAAYVLRAYRLAVTGPERESLAGVRDVGVREVAAIAPLVALLLLLGFAPQLALSVINPATGHTVSTTEAGAQK
jgi:NADH-quinone oxidoreductase subunit M